MSPERQHCPLAKLRSLSLALPQKARSSEGRELTALCAEQAAWRARVRSGSVFRCVHLSRRTRPFSLHLSLSADTVCIRRQICLHLNLRLTWLIHRRSRAGGHPLIRCFAFAQVPFTPLPCSIVPYAEGSPLAGRAKHAGVPGTASPLKRSAA